MIENIKFYVAVHCCKEYKNEYSEESVGLHLDCICNSFLFISDVGH